MKIISQIVILILLLTGGYVGWQYKDNLPYFSTSDERESKKGKRKGRSALVVVAPVKLQDLQRTVTAVGNLQAQDSVDVTSKVTAKITKLHFSEGGSVKKGDTLVTLDSIEPKAEMSESRAELGNSRKLYQRTLKLYKSGNAPKARVDLQLSELQIAEAKVAAGKARLSDYEVKAPFSGKLGFKNVSTGALVRPADVITTLDDVSILKLDFDLPESHLAAIQTGQDFQAKSVAYPDRQFEGKVTTISTRVDLVTRAVRIRGRISNEDGLLKPGMFLSVRLQTGVLKDALLVPEQAIVVSAAGHYVFVVKDGIAARTAIKIGERIRGWAQVVSGLDNDAVLVTEGLQKVRDGQKVRIAPADKPNTDQPSSGKVPTE